MNIVITPQTYFPNTCAGGEYYLRYLLRYLKCHNITIIANVESETEHDGIKILPQGEMSQIFNNHREVIQQSDIIIHQLLGNPYGHNLARHYNKKDMLICHNTSRHYFTTPKTAIVYNSHSLGNIYPNNISTVLQPLINYRDYKPSTGNKIALINCNENKGVYQFIELAKQLSNYQFVGYKGGYGTQVTPEMDNIEWKENGVINWSEITILLVPSETESWSQVATEAICSGIPVICSDLSGLRENLSYAGIFIQRDLITSYRSTIIELMENKKSYDYARERCLSRAIELDPEPRAKDFVNWLENYVNG